MAFDREGALKAAEKALRLGRIDTAIAEYLRIVEAQPRDWNSANALGDLYVRAGQVESGLAQYTRIAEHLAAEGFFPKAAALYKKILKFKPDEEPALLQAGEIAAKQGLVADAKHAWRNVAERRRARGDVRGAAEISFRIGKLDPRDLDARLTAAKAAVEIGDVATALREFRDVALAFDEQGNTVAALPAFQAALELDPEDRQVRERVLAGYLALGDVAGARTVAEGAADLKRVATALADAGLADEGLAVLSEVARLDPSDRDVRAHLAHAYAGKGDLEQARAYLDRETAGTSAPLWLLLAEIELTDAHAAEGREAVGRALALDPAVRTQALALGTRLADGEAERGYPCFDAVAEDAISRSDFSGAATALSAFVALSRHHVVALMRLVEVCVDGGLESTMQEAQASLADAYLEVGRGLEARIISEDLVAREPWNSANVDRFRRALVMLGESDPDTIIAERLSGDSPFMATDNMDLNEGIFFEDPPEASPRPEVIGKGAVIGATEPSSLDEVFERMREEAASGPEDDVAAEQYQLGVTYRDLGMDDDAIQAFELAARSPRHRFESASLLAALYRERGELQVALDWFERAAEAPAPTSDASRGLLYDFAETLETVGEHAHALAVFVELEAEAGGYRDVAGRIVRLSKPKTKG